MSEEGLLEGRRLLRSSKKIGLGWAADAMSDCMNKGCGLLLSSKEITGDWSGVGLLIQRVTFPMSTSVWGC